MTEPLELRRIDRSFQTDARAKLARPEIGIASDASRLPLRLGLHTPCALAFAMRAAANLIHELREVGPAGPSPRLDPDRERLHLLDVHVRVERDRREVVRRPARRQPARPPVVGKPDLVRPAAL